VEQHSTVRHTAVTVFCLWNWPNSNFSCFCIFFFPGCRVQCVTWRQKRKTDWRRSWITRTYCTVYCILLLRLHKGGVMDETHSMQKRDIQSVTKSDYLTWREEACSLPKLKVQLLSQNKSFTEWGFGSLQWNIVACVITGMNKSRKFTKQARSLQCFIAGFA
jgi:hypothetical protein